jgi:site-specific recombinase XerD
MPTSAEKQHVFVNQHGQPLSRDGIAYMRKYVSEVTAEGHPTLARKPSRHTCFAIAVLWRCCNPAPTSP